MASFYPTPAIATAMAMSRLGRSGGRGGKPPEEPKEAKWPMVLLCAFLILNIVAGLTYLFIDIAFTKEQPSYVVDGILVSYISRRDGKVDNAYVDILQSDAVIRRYPTYTRTIECYRHVNGIGIKVRITPYYNSVLDKITYRSKLLVDPCGK